MGAVLSPSETVTYVDGVVLKNMIKTSNRALPGDSGGPLWAGTYALAQGQYRFWYQPVHWVLAHHGLHAF